MTSFHTRLREAIESQSLIAPGEGVVIGVSGGADSMALLTGLAALQSAGALQCRLHVAHLNHGLRGADADEDARFVRKRADDLHLPCTVETDDLLMQLEGKRTLEEFARQRRYAFLCRVASHTGSSVVAVGHHADDNVETILHRIIRGTGFRGLMGIPASRELQRGTGIRLVRPLLRFRRAELELFLHEHNVPYRTDATNRQIQRTRNRIRARVLPELRRTINPSVDDAILRLADQGRAVHSFLSVEAERAFLRLRTGDASRGIRLDIRGFVRLPAIVQAETVRRALLEMQAGEKKLGFEHLARVLELAATAERRGKLHLPGGIVVQAEAGHLCFERPSRAAPGQGLPPVQINLPGRTPLPAYHLYLDAEFVDSHQPGVELDRWKQSKPGNQEWLDRGQVHPPLIVRVRRAGERFQPLGAAGARTVSDVLSDAKVLRSQRGRVPILCDQEGPIWVIPHRIAERVKVTSSTRSILKLSVHPLDSGV